MFSFSKDKFNATMYLIFNREPIALYQCFYPKLIMPEAFSVISNLEIIKFVLYEIIKEEFK